MQKKKEEKDEIRSPTNLGDLKLYIIKDLERLSEPTLINSIKALSLNGSFKITFWFRVGSYLRQKKNILYKLAYVFVFIIYKRNQFKTGIQLPLGTKIGQGIVFAHFSCIVINENTVIGNNCKIFQGVTLGTKRGKNGGAPMLGHNVVVSSGAKVIGKVIIGDNVMIGANTVVTNDIPENAVVVGSPAKIINYNGKYHTNLYLTN